MSDRTVAVCSAAALYCSASESMYVSFRFVLLTFTRRTHLQCPRFRLSQQARRAPNTAEESWSTPPPPVTLEQLTTRAVTCMPASSELIMHATSLHASESSLTSSHVVSTSASTAHTGRPLVTLAPSLDKPKTSFNAFSFVHTRFSDSTLPLDRFSDASYISPC
ncbi:hypothetical protein F5148DRAFT_1265443 [Russula earlei]|uniref:Uncharacterized protein n=1 Tax=Russula earlei TaxID=71964 RepID=A0ACC0TRK0_9AGAM|nr:hypothetical protein F5148DRAFT_1265443 [Russula earlei]